MSAYQEEARIEIEAPAEVAVSVLADARRVLMLVPREYARVLDLDRRLVELSFRRGLFGLRDTFTLHIEVEGENVLLYHIISQKYTIFVRMEVIGRGPRRSELVAQIRGIGFNFPRFAQKIRDFLEKWIAAIKISVETAFESGAVPAARPKPEAAATSAFQPRRRGVEAPSPRGASAAETGRTEARAPGPRGAGGFEISGTLEESGRLDDPLFEAEALVRGRVLRVDTLIAGSLDDILSHIGNVLQGRVSGVYLIRLDLPRGQASMLIRDGKITGALYEYRGEKAAGREALDRIGSSLPGEVSITIITMG